MAGKKKTVSRAVQKGIAGPREKAFSFLVYGLFFLFLIYPYRDLDWGVHYRYGEYLLTHGQLLRRDIFSWTMEGYEWVNHSWLYDLLVYVIFKYFSFGGLSIAGAVVCLLSFYLGVKKYRLSYWQIGILALFFQNATTRIIGLGLRSQVLALLLFSLLLYFLLEERDGKKWSYFALPPLFLAWANLHGSFTLGLAIFAVFLLCDFLLLFRSKVILIPRRWVLLFASFLASAALTFVNPFTYQVYVEAMRHFGDPLLPYVTEWDKMPLASWSGIFVASYTCLLLVGFVLRRRLTDVPLIVISLMLLYLAAGALRHVAPFLVVTLPFAAMTLAEVHFSLDRFKFVPILFLAIIAVTLGFAFTRVFSFRLAAYSWEAYCFYGPKCSEDLTRYLLQNPPVGRGLNFYDWGGYLIGRGLRTKIFIDGRMHLWERDGYRPFVEYWKIYNQRDLSRFRQYRFDWVIAQPNSPLSRVLESSTKGLELGQWKKVFSDRWAAYFVRE